MSRGARAPRRFRGIEETGFRAGFFMGGAKSHDNRSVIHCDCDCGASSIPFPASA